MAGIPAYDPQVAPRPLGAPYDETRVSPATFGAGTGQALQQIGSAVGDIAKQEREKVIAGQAMQAEANIEGAANQEVQNFRTLKGSTAGQRSQEFTDRVSAAREKLLRDIQDPDVRRIATMRTLGTVVQASKHIGAWTAEQNDVALGEGFSAKSASTLTDIAMNATDPAARQRVVDNMQAPLVIEGRRQGLAGSPADPATPLGDFVAKWKASAAKTAVDSMIGQNLIPQAQAYMALPGVRESLARLGPQQLEAIENRLRTHADTQGAIVDALALVRKYTTPGTTLFDEQQALADAGKLKVNPERQLKTIELIEQQAGRQRTAQTQRNASVFSKAMAVYQRTGTLSPTDPQDAAVIADAQAYLLNPANQATGLWEHLKDRARADARRDMTDPPTPTERDAARQIRWEMAQDQFRTKYLTMTPEQLQADDTFQSAHPKDQNAIYNEFLRLQDSTRKGADAAAKTIPDPVTAMLIRKGRGGPFPKGNKSPKDWAQWQRDLYDAAYLGVTQQASQFAATAGKPPSYEDYERFIDKEFAKGVVVGGGRVFGDAETTLLESQVLPRFQGKEFREGRVNVLGPDGKRFTLPSSQVEAFLRSDRGRGFRRE